MYRPARPRPRKTTITRSRSGCEGCRQRRKRCDEQKPRRRACQRLGLHCNYGQTFQFRSVYDGVTQETNSSPARAGLGALDPGCNHVRCQPQTISPDLAPPHMSIESRGTLVRDSESGSLYYDTTVSDTVPEETRTTAGVDNINLSAEFLQVAAAKINSDNSLYDPDNLLFTQESPPLLEPPGQIKSNASGRDQRLRALPPLSIQEDASPHIAAHSALYETAWQDYCVPALPPILKYVVDSISTLPAVIRWSALALSASRLSRLQPQSASNAAQPPQLRPNRTHWIASQQFYCSATREIVSWEPADKRQDVSTMIQAILLLCCLESATGNFEVFRLHSEGIQALIKGGIKAILSVDLEGGIRLLQAWAQTKMHSWWLRCHFDTPRFLLSDVSFRVEPQLYAYLSVKNTRRTSVMVNLCESYRLDLSLIIRQLGSIELHALGLVSQRTIAADELLSANGLALDEDELRKQSRLLSSWLSHRADSDLPFDSASDTDAVTFPCSNLSVRPLLFNTHAAAMNYAYYTTARIIQAASGVKSLCSSTLETSNIPKDETAHWSLLLLRIAAGLQWEKCLNLNTFSIGLSGLLMVCSLRCPDLDVSRWIQSWVELRCNGENSEEGSFPVSQVRRTLSLLNQERANGIDVVAVFQPNEDEGRQGKADSYRNQSLTSVRLLCRSRNGGIYTVRHRTM
ncbi:hypothetical protein NLU13_7605 [Sarocladium strictum]|uniref:Zn(2)-C6 fungal-type domain-containing protein n=1 Tax=Sarocladium strictum TaxID=5046 RepID=A0AA39L5R1_SARSR|nr:hypothetical protein NLU13_7605 [Sarocladium strictum]